ncbi:MAG: peptidylprolyl isomerase [Candidatus Krumholzibacteriota bacterium]|nr:peptidylprolyl isomerase [Candidatus Krumholzibacteriota bacterium]
MRPASKRSGARVLPTLLVVILALGVATLFGCATPKGSKEDGVKETVVTLVTAQGEIVLRFFPDVAPEHVKNFVHHSESGLYQGCTFHRVIPGFMIQGGDPNSKDDDPTNDGMGGYSYRGEDTTLKAEFNDRPHLRGTLSMARANDPNSAGSQFFICHAAAPFLDGKYSVFGEVIDGMDAVDKIANADRDGNDRPHEDQVILQVLVEEWPTAKVEEMRAAMSP